MVINMDLNKRLKGHLIALFTVFVWANTFITTKLLLNSFTPVEIMVIRFLIGTIALFIAYPKIVIGKNLKEELIFALAGLCGVTLYFLFENISLSYTFASNVSIIVAAAPFFTGLLSFLFLKGEKPGGWFFVGFVVAMIGIGLITFNDVNNMRINPFGDFLALLAGMIWACYAVLSKKIADFGYNIIGYTRRIFEYGLIFMIPAIAAFGFNPDFETFKSPNVVLSFVFLGVLACAVCYVTWNKAVVIIGAVKTAVYIYLQPVITVVCAMLVLKEKTTLVSTFGIVLTLLGLLLSERKK